MWDLPGPVIEPMSPALAGGFLTTAPQGSPRVPLLTTIPSCSFATPSCYFCYFVKQLCFLRGSFIHFLFSSQCAFYPLLCKHPSRASQLISKAPESPSLHPKLLSSFSKYLLNTYCVLGTVLGTWASSVKKTKTPASLIGV